MTNMVVFQPVVEKHVKQIEFWHISNGNFNLWNYLETCLGVSTKIEHTHNLRHRNPFQSHTIFTPKIHTRMWTHFVIRRSVVELISTLTPPRVSALLESGWDPGYTAWWHRARSLSGGSYSTLSSLKPGAAVTSRLSLRITVCAFPPSQTFYWFTNPLDENGQGNHSPVTLFLPRGKQYSHFLHCKPVFVNFL